MPTTVMEVERGINNIKLDEGNTKPNGDKPARVSWLEDTAKVSGQTLTEHAAMLTKPRSKKWAD
jgi:hypothetical protein